MEAPGYAPGSPRLQRGAFTRSARPPNFWLPRRDSDPDLQIQNLTCYQLHHGGMAMPGGVDPPLPARQAGVQSRYTMAPDGRPAPTRTGNLRFGDEDDPLSPLAYGRGDGSWTHVSSLGSWRTTVVRRPVERAEGVAPSSLGWKPSVLLLNDARAVETARPRRPFPGPPPSRSSRPDCHRAPPPAPRVRGWACGHFTGKQKTPASSRARGCQFLSGATSSPLPRARPGPVHRLGYRGASRSPR